MVGLELDAGEARGVLVTGGELGHERPRVHLLQGPRSPRADAYFGTQPSNHDGLKRCKRVYAEVVFKRFSLQHYFIMKRERRLSGDGLRGTLRHLMHPYGRRSKCGQGA